MSRAWSVMLASGLLWCKPAPSTVTVGAAVSLKESFGALASRYDAAHPGTHVELVFGSSGDLAAQMRHGAPFDVFASAGEESTGAERRCTLARNTLVLVHPPGHAITWEGLGETAPAFRLAIGLAPQVPAGVYAEDALHRLGIWDAVQGKLVRGTNVRHVLDLVLRGEADAGLVYATDVATRKEIVSAGEVPARARPDIQYPLFVAHGASKASLAVADFLCSSEATGELTLRGFLPP